MRRANEILAAAAAFLAAELDRPRQVLIDFIDGHRGRFAVEPICKVLREHGLPIVPSSYHASRHHRPSSRELRDHPLVEPMVGLREKNRLLIRFGARTPWVLLRSQGHDVARCTIERLHRTQGWQGTTRRRKV